MRARIYILRTFSDESSGFRLNNGGLVLQFEPKFDCRFAKRRLIFRSTRISFGCIN